MSRRFQFSLESIFRLMTVVAVACVAVPLASGHIRENALAYEAMTPIGAVVLTINVALFWFIFVGE